MSEHMFPKAMLNLLGFVRMLQPEDGWTRMEFEARVEHTHSSGTTVQGGLLTAWMDHAMARAAVDHDPALMILSLEIKTTFMSRVGPGLHVVAARGGKWGRKVAFLQAQVCDSEGRVLASSTSTALVLAGSAP